jgi:signal transduction histidine kinase/ActR/RegA family two-component response regulator
MFWMFGAFIITCGFTHLLEVITFYDPVYRLSGLVKLVTALASWATVVGLVPLVPRALALRGPEELEREIAARTAELAQANAALQAQIAERRRAQELAEEANRSKDQFLALLSHELRTPLGAMLGWLYLLRGGKLNAAMAARGLEVLERNTRAQAQLIDDLLDVSRIGAGKLRLEAQPTELAPVVEAAVDALRPAARAKDITLRVARDVSAGPVLGDATRLQQVFWNLLANAVKFTPPGGRVEVRLERADGQAQVIVQDNGEGIRPDFLPHVFEPFRQADSSMTRAHGGLGLGLAIVRHLVELHGGTISAASPGAGQGATFTVRLPIAPARFGPPRHESPSRAADGSAEVPLAGLRVLAVDDEPDARDLLSLVLAQGGAEVRAAGSAEEALATLEGWRPDVVVSDIAMPGEDGYGLIRRLRARAPEEGGRIPAVALTAYARAEDRARALAAGFQVHAPKPIDPEELVTVVRALAAWSRR